MASNISGGEIIGRLGGQGWAGPIGITGVTGFAQNSGIFSTKNYGADVALPPLKDYLIRIASEKQKEAYDYRDAILLQTPIKINTPPFIVLKGSLLHPILLGYVPDPSSFEWYLEEPKECKGDWAVDEIYEVPSKHKFLDSNILPGSGYIVPMELVLRPLDLNDDRFFFSWYGGFVVPK